MQEGRLCRAPVWSDLWSLDPSPWAGRLDVVAAGIPCQPWSMAGRRRGHKDERHMWAPTYRFIQAVRPGVFFLENVPGIVSGGGLEPIWRDLREMDYGVEAGFFSAVEVGAPHIRKRLFVLAYAAGQPNRWPKPARREGVRPEALHTRGDGASGHLADAKVDRQRARHSDAVGDGPTCEQRPSARKGGTQRDGAGTKDGNARAPRAAQCRVGDASDGLSAWLDPHPWRDGWEDDTPRIAVNEPHRIDKLRALGNAVVPQTAAIAFSTLAAKVGLTFS